MESPGGRDLGRNNAAGIGRQQRHGLKPLASSPYTQGDSLRAEAPIRRWLPELASVTPPICQRHHGPSNGSVTGAIGAPAAYRHFRIYASLR